ncbi:MAG: hypothetical protein ACE10H_00675, partial [Candidatus Binatia bacterium]
TIVSPPKLAPSKFSSLLLTVFIAVTTAHIRVVEGSSPPTATKTFFRLWPESGTLTAPGDP